MPPQSKGKEPKVKKKPGRTPTSCAECRRLKLRCDKNIPCEKCVQRNCAEICPNGILAPMRGNRMVLLGTEELHERISQLQGRIRDLETALRTMQEAVSDGPHPLLQNDTLRLPPLPPSQPNSSPSASSSSKSPAAVSQASPPTRTHPVPVNVAKVEEEDRAIDAFGTLTIGQDGASIFIGKTARSEFLIRAPMKQEFDIALAQSSHLPPRLSLSESPFPDLDVRDEPHLREQVYKVLPPLSEALRLSEIYLEHGKCMYTPVSRKELLDEILMTIYSTRHETFQSHHALALLFSVFALASHFDSHKENDSIEAREYYQLARTSLGFASPVRQTTLAAIQTLIHMSQFLDFTDSESPSAWMYIGHAVRFAFSIGLHLDGARWNLSKDDIDRRSRVFWQLFTLDTWTSFYFGRPPSMSPSFIDCEYPKEPEGTTALDTPFHSWSYRFAALLGSAMATGMGPKQPAYATILQLDRQIRDFHVPMEWKPTAQRENTLPVHIHLYRWLVLSSKETVLLNLHRAYFAQALHDSPNDIQRHRYLPSVVAIYRASWRLIDGLQLAWENVPHILARIHLPWSQALSAAIVMCLLVTKIPSSHLTAAAMEKLENLYSLFHTASGKSKPAATHLPSIQSLCLKAHEAINPTQHHTTGYSQHPISQTELDRLSGKTHLFSDARSSPDAQIASSSMSSSLSSSHDKIMYGERSRSTSVTLSDIPPDLPPSIPTIVGGPTDTLHPIILEDLKDFAARRVIPTNTSLCDTPSDSEGNTPTGIEGPRLRVPAGMDIISSGSGSGSPSSSPSASTSSSMSLLPTMSTPSFLPQATQPQLQTPLQRHHRPSGAGSYPIASSSSYPPRPSSPETTPTHMRHSHGRPDSPHRFNTAFSSTSSSSSNHRHLTHQQHHHSHPHHLQSSSNYSATMSSQPTATPVPPPPLHPPSAVLPHGFTTEFHRHFYDVRQSSGSGMGSGGVGSSGLGLGAGGGGGFVSGFEPGGSIILDGTWQGFLEQLGF